MHKRIAILTLSVGSGHIQAAKAIERALEDGAEPVDVRVLDALELARPWFLWLYVRSYWWMLRRAPGVWRRLFDRRQMRHHSSTAPHWIFRRGCPEVFRSLKQYSPQLVIATEIGAAEIASMAKREAWINAPILAVHTDLETEPPWAQREIDVFTVAGESARSQLVRWGVSPNRILVCGIPIDPAFALPFDRPEVLRALGMEAQRPVILVMGGGMGPVPLDEVVLSLEKCGLPIQVLAVAGHNQSVRARLEALRGKVAMDLHVFGWSENIPELMAAADLVITKPGGVTMSEVLAAGRPLILTHPIPGPEERHALHLEQQGVALRARMLQDIPRLASRLLGNRKQLTEMESRAREMARPDAAHAVAQVARAMLEKGTYIDLLGAPRERAGESAYLM